MKRCVCVLATQNLVRQLACGFVLLAPVTIHHALSFLLAGSRTPYFIRPFSFCADVACSRTALETENSRLKGVCIFRLSSCGPLRWLSRFSNVIWLLLSLVSEAFLFSEGRITSKKSHISSTEICLSFPRHGASEEE